VSSGVYNLQNFTTTTVVKCAINEDKTISYSESFSCVPVYETAPDHDDSYNNCLLTSSSIYPAGYSGTITYTKEEGGILMPIALYAGDTVGLTFFDNSSIPQD
jgi:hypothetical protein